jgi:predicted DNA-binding protein
MSDYRRAVHTSIRLPIETSHELKQCADRHDRSVTRQIIRFVREGLARDKAADSDPSEPEHEG